MKALVALIALWLAGTAAAQDGDENLHSAVDRALAMKLVDPTEVIAYEVGGLVPCRDLARSQRRSNRQCVCYAFNARNRAGGYSGKTLRYGVAGALSDGQYIVADAGEVENRSGGQACAASGMVARDGRRIAAAVR